MNQGARDKPDHRARRCSRSGSNFCYADFRSWEDHMKLFSVDAEVDGLFMLRN